MFNVKDDDLNAVFIYDYPDETEEDVEKFKNDLNVRHLVVH